MNSCTVRPDRDTDVTVPPPPQVRLALGATGHCAGHKSFAANEERIAAAMAAVLDIIDQAAGTAPS